MSAAGPRRHRLTVLRQAPADWKNTHRAGPPQSADVRPSWFETAGSTTKVASRRARRSRRAIKVFVCFVSAVRPSWFETAASTTKVVVSSDPITVQSRRRALEALAQVLAGSRAHRYRAKSSSNPNAQYEIAVEGEDVTCSCPGFEYRGQCRHAREVKHAIVSG